MRRVKQVENCELKVPPNLSLLYGDIFKQLQVKVHYSEVDNDDTMAAFAQKHGAAILS